jgi:hypothetical protein
VAFFADPFARFLLLALDRCEGVGIFGDLRRVELAGKLLLCKLGTKKHFKKKHKTEEGARTKGLLRRNTFGVVDATTHTHASVSSL